MHLNVCLVLSTHLREPLPGLWHAEGSQLDFGDDGSQGGFDEEEGSDPEGFQEQSQEEEDEDASQVDYDENGSREGFDGEGDLDYEGSQGQSQEEEEENACQVDYDENGSGEGFDGEGDLDYEGSQGQNQDEEGGESEHASVGEYNEDQEAEEGMPR